MIQSAMPNLPTSGAASGLNEDLERNPLYTLMNEHDERPQPHQTAMAVYDQGSQALGIKNITIQG